MEMKRVRGDQKKFKKKKTFLIVMLVVVVEFSRDSPDPDTHTHTHSHTSCSVQMCCCSLSLSLSLSLSSGAIAFILHGCQVRYILPPPKGLSMNERLPQWALAPSSYDYIAVLLMVLSAAGDLKRIEVLLNKVEEEQHRRTIEPLAARERHAAAGRGPVVEFLRAFFFVFFEISCSFFSFFFFIVRQQ